jgi:hypothetical protein
VGHHQVEPGGAGGCRALLGGLRHCARPARRAAQAPRCADRVDSHLAGLPLAPGDVQSVRIVEKVNIADDFGPEILGVDAWVRLNSCSGWLVINMTATCHVRQTYTRGDCRIEGLPSY